MPWSFPGVERDAQLANWRSAPFAGFAHPREEHLIPLLVAAGEGGDAPGVRIFGDEPMGAAIQRLSIRLRVCKLAVLLPVRPVQQHADPRSRQNRPRRVHFEAQQQQRACQGQSPRPSVHQRGPAQRQSHRSHQRHGGGVHAVEKGRS